MVEDEQCGLDNVSSTNAQVQDESHGLSVGISTVSNFPVRTPSRASLEDISLVKRTPASTSVDDITAALFNKTPARTSLGDIPVFKRTPAQASIDNIAVVPANKETPATVSTPLMKKNPRILACRKKAPVCDRSSIDNIPTVFPFARRRFYGGQKGSISATNKIQKLPEENDQNSCNKPLEKNKKGTFLIYLGSDRR